jgi:hypothetical protein
VRLEDLNDAGREELALAILLWKDFKSDGKVDPTITLAAIKFAMMLGVEKQFDALLSKLPPMKVTPR